MDASMPSMTEKNTSGGISSSRPRPSPQAGAGRGIVRDGGVVEYDHG